MTDIIMCASVLNNKTPDECYEKEYAAAKKVTNVKLFDINLLMSLPKSDGYRGENPTLIYHGWMMTPAQYRHFFLYCEYLGYKLINTPAQYSGCHHFDRWYPLIEDLTPKSLIVPKNAIRPMMDEVAKFMYENDCGVILKDYVKSLKHDWDAACYIPKDANALHIAKVISTFVHMKEDVNDFQGNLVVRKFVNLKKIGQHNKSKMPLTQEYRSYIMNGKLLSTYKYWEQGNYGAETPPEEFILKIAERIVKGTNSKLFTIDTAQLESGEWTCIEVGDGQVSALPEHEDKESFFKKLIEAAQ